MGAGPGQGAGQQKYPRADCLRQQLAVASCSSSCAPASVRSEVAAVRSLSHLGLVRSEALVNIWPARLRRRRLGVAEAAGKQTAEQMANTVCFLVLAAVNCTCTAQLPACTAAL